MDAVTDGGVVHEEPLPYPFNSNEGVSVSDRYDQVRALPRLAKVKLLNGEPAWLVTGYADARFVLSDPRFSRAAGAGKVMPSQADLAPSGAGLIGLDPPEHTRMRAIVAKSFSVHEVERSRPRVRAMVEDLLDRMEKNGSTADLIDDFSVPVSIGVIADMVGVPAEYRSQIREWSDARMSAAGWTQEEITAKAGRLRASVAELVAARGGRTSDGEVGDDLLGTLIAARANGDLTDDGLLDLAMAMLVAGYEGPVNQIGKFTFYLMDHPELWAALRAEPDRLPAAVDEMLRFIPLFRGAGTMPRYPLTDVEIRGTLVKAGEPILVAIGGSNRDADQFDTPGEFRTDRDRTSHLAWGHGVHNCIGKPLATIQLQEAIGGLVRRFEHLRLASEVDWKVQVIRGAHHMPVTWAR